MVNSKNAEIHWLTIHRQALLSELSITQDTGL